MTPLKKPLPVNAADDHDEAVDKTDRKVAESAEDQAFDAPAEATEREPEAPESSRGHATDKLSRAAEDEAELAPAVEALLFATDRPLSANRIAQLTERLTAPQVNRIIATLNRRYEKTKCSFRVQAIAKGYQMLTLPEYDAYISRLLKSRRETRMTEPALETLAVIAYKQPITRAEIEAIRGVAVGDVLLRLREMNLVKIVGRAEALGRPMLYGTTDRFLEVFGLSSLKDLPKTDELPQAGEINAVVRNNDDEEDFTVEG